MAHHDDKKKRKVRRLVDVDVSHLSLVDRPANRTPFKFIKRDGTAETQGEFPMNHTLKNLFGSRDPEVTSVIADTKAKATAVAKMLMEGDGTVAEQDGLFVVRKSGTQPSEEERLVHLGKRAGIAYTVANMRKELRLYDMESEDFDDAIKQEGFVPGLMVGMDALHATIRNIAMAEDTSSADQFRTKVSKAIEDFGSYVDSLIGALPEKAFKFEKALAAVTPQGTTPLHFTPEGYSQEVYDAVFGDEAPNPSATMADADEGKAAAAEGGTASEGAEGAAEGGDKGATADGAATGTATDGKAADGAAPTAATDGKDAAPADPADTKPDNLEELPASAKASEGVDMEKAMQDAIAGMTKSMGDQISAALKPLADRADKTDAAIASLTKAVGGTVASAPEEDNVVHLSKTGNDELADYGDGAPPLIDTAYKVNKG